MRDAVPVILGSLPYIMNSERIASVVSGDGGFTDDPLMVPANDSATSGRVPSSSEAYGGLPGYSALIKVRLQCPRGFPAVSRLISHFTRLYWGSCPGRIPTELTPKS